MLRRSGHKPTSLAAQFAAKREAAKGNQPVKCLVTAHNDTDFPFLPTVLNTSVGQKFAKTSKNALLKVTSADYPDLKFYVRNKAEHWSDSVKGLSIVESVLHGLELSGKGSVVEDSKALQAVEVELTLVTDESEAALQEVVMVLYDLYLSKRDLWFMHREMMQEGANLVYKNYGQNYGLHVARSSIEFMASHDFQTVLSGCVTPETQLTLKSGSANVTCLVQLSSDLFQRAHTGGQYWELLLGLFQQVLIRLQAHRSDCDGHYIQIVVFARVKPTWKEWQEECEDLYDVLWEGHARSMPPEEVLVQEVRRLCESIQNQTVSPPTQDNEKGLWSHLGMAAADDDGELDLGGALGHNATAEGWQDIYPEHLVSAEDGPVLECLNIILDSLDRHHLDRMLKVTGQTIVLLTSSPGVLHTELKLHKLTHRRFTTAGPSSQQAFHMISIREPPTYAPLFLWEGGPDPCEAWSRSNGALMHQGEAPMSPDWITLTYFDGEARRSSHSPWVPRLGGIGQRYEGASIRLEPDIPEDEHFERQDSGCQSPRGSRPTPPQIRSPVLGPAGVSLKDLYRELDQNSITWPMPRRQNFPIFQVPSQNFFLPETVSEEDLSLYGSTKGKGQKWTWARRVTPFTESFWSDLEAPQLRPYFRHEAPGGGVSPSRSQWPHLAKIDQNNFPSVTSYFLQPTRFRKQGCTPEEDKLERLLTIDDLVGCRLEARTSELLRFAEQHADPYDPLIRGTGRKRVIRSCNLHLMPDEKSPIVRRLHVHKGRFVEEKLDAGVAPLAVVEIAGPVEKSRSGAELVKIKYPSVLTDVYINTSDLEKVRMRPPAKESLPSYTVRAANGAIEWKFEVQDNGIEVTCKDSTQSTDAQSQAKRLTCPYACFVRRHMASQGTMLANFLEGDTAYEGTSASDSRLMTRTPTDNTVLYTSKASWSFVRRIFHLPMRPPWNQLDVVLCGDQDLQAALPYPVAEPTATPGDKVGPGWELRSAIKQHLYVLVPEDADERSHEAYFAEVLKMKEGKLETGTDIFYVLEQEGGAGENGSSGPSKGTTGGDAAKASSRKARPELREGAAQRFAKFKADFEELCMGRAQRRRPLDVEINSDGKRFMVKRQTRTVNVRETTLSTAEQINSRDWFALFYDSLFAPPKPFVIVMQWLACTSLHLCCFVQRLQKIASENGFLLLTVPITQMFPQPAPEWVWTTERETNFERLAFYSPRRIDLPKRLTSCEEHRELLNAKLLQVWVSQLHLTFLFSAAGTHFAVQPAPSFEGEKTVRKEIKEIYLRLQGWILCDKDALACIALRESCILFFENRLAHVASMDKDTCIRMKTQFSNLWEKFQIATEGAFAAIEKSVDSPDSGEAKSVSQLHTGSIAHDSC